LLIKFRVAMFFNDKHEQTINTDKCIHFEDVRVNWIQKIKGGFQVTLDSFFKIVDRGDDIVIKKA